MRTRVTAAAFLSHALTDRFNRILFCLLIIHIDLPVQDGYKEFRLDKFNMLGRKKNPETVQTDAKAFESKTHDPLRRLGEMITH